MFFFRFFFFEIRMLGEKFYITQENYKKKIKIADTIYEFSIMIIGVIVIVLYLIMLMKSFLFIVLCFYLLFTCN